MGTNASQQRSMIMMVNNSISGGERMKDPLFVDIDPVSGGGEIEGGELLIKLDCYVSECLGKGL